MRKGKPDIKKFFRSNNDIYWRVLCSKSDTSPLIIGIGFFIIANVYLKTRAFYFKVFIYVITTLRTSEARSSGLFFVTLIKPFTSYFKNGMSKPRSK